MSKRFKLTTILSTGECESRLVSMIDHESFDLRRLSIGGGSKPVVGEVTPDGFLLRRRSEEINSFQTVAVGTIKSLAKGTVIEGRCSAHPGLRWGYAAWGCFMVLLGVPMLLHLLYALGSGVINWAGLWDTDHRTETTGLLMLCAFPVVFALGRGSATGDDEYLLGFLVTTLEAHPI